MRALRSTTSSSDVLFYVLDGAGDRGLCAGGESGYTAPDPLPPCSGHVDLDLNGVDADMTGGETTTITTAKNAKSFLFIRLVPFLWEESSLDCFAQSRGG